MKKNIYLLVIFVFVIIGTSKAEIIIDSSLQTSACDSSRVIIWFHSTVAVSPLTVYKAELVGIIPILNIEIGTPIEIAETYALPAMPPPIGNGISQLLLGYIPPGTSAGLYYIRLINTNNNDTSDFSTMPVIITPNAMEALNTIEHKCKGDSVVLTTTGLANSYLWSTGHTTQSITVSKRGTYSVTTKDVFNCESKTSYTIESNPIIQECSGQDVQLKSSIDASRYYWSMDTSKNEKVVIVNDTTNDSTGVVYYLETSNPVSCASSNPIYYSTCAYFDVNVYPNPSEGVFALYITTDFNAVEFDLVNRLGEVVYSFNDFKNTPIYKKTINIQGLARGLYFLRVNTGENIKTQKLVINY